MENPSKIYDDVLKIAREEADYDPKGDFCAQCGTVFEDRGECKVCSGREVEAGWVNPETGELQKEMPDKVQYIDDSDYVSNYREDIYGKLDGESYADELDHYEPKQQLSQADWDEDLTDMRKQFAGANDEVEEEDGLDEDRVEIDISGDDVEIEDHDDADSREFMINPEDEPEWEEGEWNEIEDIAQEPKKGESYEDDYYPEDSKGHIDADGNTIWEEDR